MAAIVKTTTKKVWVAPELKKTSIEQITAAGVAGSTDGKKGTKS